MYFLRRNLMTNLPNRRPCVTTDVGEGLAVTVSFHPETNTPVEVFLSGRGKKASDGPMTDALYNMGVEASKMMQNKDTNYPSMDAAE
tara:strand:- start:103 stop:363 length:261 start_codon:yes stop_codon:yes gene_type:complete